MVRKVVVLLILLTVAASLPAAAKMRGASTPEDRTRALEYARSLEQNPLAKDSLAKRMWLTEWLVQVSDVKVSLCCKDLKALDEVNDTYSNQLRMQVLYSQVAFLLQHPGIKDPTAVTVAGLSGTLRAYRAIQRFDPTVMYPVLDDLIALERQGKLQQYVLQQKTSCKEN